MQGLWEEISVRLFVCELPPWSRTTNRKYVSKWEWSSRHSSSLKVSSRTVTQELLKKEWNKAYKRVYYSKAI